MNIKVGTYSLAGTAWNEKVSDFKVSWQRSVVVQPHYRADYPSIRAGDNQVATVTFQVARLHEDYRVATAFMLDHGGSVPRSGRVTIEFETDAGFVRRYFESASCQTFDGEQIGVTTIHRYQVIGTRLLSSNAQALALARQSTRAGTGSATGATGSGGSSGTTSGSSGSTGPTTLRKDFLTPSSEWRWVHGLGYWPEVEAYNTSGQKLLSAVVNEDLNTVVVTHAANIAGYLVITI